MGEGESVRLGLNRRGAGRGIDEGEARRGEADRGSEGGVGGVNVFLGDSVGRSRCSTETSGDAGGENGFAAGVSSPNMKPSSSSAPKPKLRSGSTGGEETGLTGEPS